MSKINTSGEYAVVKKSRYIVLLFTLLTNYSIAQSTWFDDQSIGSTVLLEKSYNATLQPFGTGFLLFNYTNIAIPYLVTCAHLINNRPEIYVSITADSEFVAYVNKMKNPDDYSLILGKTKWILFGQKMYAQIKLQKNKTYVVHPDSSIDIAVIPVDIGSQAEIDGKTIKLAKINAIPKLFYKYRADVKLGDEVFFVGFPLGWGAVEKILNPLVRSGSIAWYSKEYKYFLVDALSWGGNSGSPVFLKRNLSNNVASLIGMVKGHYSDPYSDQNAGLAECIWLDDILTTVDLAKKLQ